MQKKNNSRFKNKNFKKRENIEKKGRRKKKKKRKENSTELQKPNVQAEVYDNNKNCD